MSTDVTVIIRSSGERTSALCRKIVADQVDESQVQVIQESPFLAAVQKTFEIGLREGRKWTLAVDADILLTSDAIAQMISSAEALNDDRLYVYQGFVLDKIFGRPRNGGPHLYNTQYLAKALAYLTGDFDQQRPESYTYRMMSKAGYLFYNDDKVYGLHDYFQFHRDYFRKAVQHSTKFYGPEYTPVFLKHWNTSKEEQPMFGYCLEGYFYGLTYPELFELDVSKLNDELSEKYMIFKGTEAEATLPEKPNYVDLEIGDHFSLFPQHKDLLFKRSRQNKGGILKKLAEFTGNRLAMAGKKLIEWSKKGQIKHWESN